MRVSELLVAIASWLESPDNEALLLSEYDEKCLDVVAKACVQAAETLKTAAVETDKIEPPAESKLTPEALDHLNQIITAFDKSDDEDLKKTASVMDELLFTIAAPPNWAANYKEAQQNRLDVLKQKYEDTKSKMDDMNKVKESAEAIDKSPMFKEYRILQAPLQTRTCPDHPGSQIARVGEHMWQCSLDKKVYNYEAGYTTEKGDKVPGGSVSEQTKVITYQNPHSIFDTREQRLGLFPPAGKDPHYQ